MFVYAIYDVTHNVQHYAKQSSLFLMVFFFAFFVDKIKSENAKTEKNEHSQSHFTIP